MNFLSRVFHGRVAKQSALAKQKLTIENSHGNRQTNPLCAPTARHLQSPDRNSNRHIRSVSRGRRSKRIPVGDTSRIKRERENEVLPLVPDGPLDFDTEPLQQYIKEEHPKMDSFNGYQQHAVSNTHDNPILDDGKRSCREVFEADDDKRMGNGDPPEVNEEDWDNEDSRHFNDGFQEPIFSGAHSVVNSSGSDDVIPSIESDFLKDEIGAHKDEDEIADGQVDVQIDDTLDDQDAETDETVVAVDYETVKRRAKQMAFRSGKRGDTVQQGPPHAYADNEDLDADFEEELEAELEPDLMIAEEDLLDYVRHKKTIADADTWPKEACRLYKLLYLRGLYPLYPAHWQRWHLGLNPVPDELFSPDGCDEKAFLKPYRDHMHHHGSKAIRAVFQLFIRVDLLRSEGMNHLITRYLERELGQYIRWGEKDIDFWQKLDYISNMRVIAYRDVAQASSRTVVEACQKAAKRYRSKYAAVGIAEYPRMLYVFVIIQHIVVIMAVDTREDKADEEPFPFAELDMSKKAHWLDSALGIAITVQLARESLSAYRGSFPERKVVESDSDA